MSRLLERVRKAITESGLSQTALAKAGVGSQAMISLWFKAEGTEPNSASLGRLVRVLRAHKYFINGHWLLTEEGEQFAEPPAGTDEVFQSGVLRGLRLAETLLRQHRATLGDASIAEDVIDVVRALDQATDNPKPGKPQSQKRAGDR